MSAIWPAGLPAIFLATALAAACGSGEQVGDSTTPEPTCPPLVEDMSLTVPDPPDGAAQCATGACNYQTQDGCPADQACRPQFNATDVEVKPGCEAAGTGEAGDDCTAQGDCARGSYCAEGVCRKMCCGADWSACDEGESCIRSLQVKAGGEVIAADVDLCFPVGTCDPFDPDGCDAANRECKIVDPTGAVACAPRSNADVGEACAPPTVCKQGLNCVGGYCVKLCRFSECGEPACAEAEGSCTHFERDPPGVGECTLGR
jgi:hypothetical protein